MLNPLQPSHEQGALNLRTATENSFSGYADIAWVVVADRAIDGASVSTTSRVGTAIAMSMIGLAAIPGIAVLPTCSITSNSNTETEEDPTTLQTNIPLPADITTPRPARGRPRHRLGLVWLLLAQARAIM